MAKVKLLKGKGQDIIDTNINALKSAGYSHNHATHFALRHANKSISKLKAKKITAKVKSPFSQVRVK